jgi:hypothetical protein
MGTMSRSIYIYISQNYLSNLHATCWPHRVVVRCEGQAYIGAGRIIIGFATSTLGLLHHWAHCIVVGFTKSSLGCRHGCWACGIERWARQVNPGLDTWTLGLPHVDRPGTPHTPVDTHCCVRGVVTGLVVVGFAVLLLGSPLFRLGVSRSIVVAGLGRARGGVRHSFAGVEMANSECTVMGWELVMTEVL